MKKPFIFFKLFATYLTIVVILSALILFFSFGTIRKFYISRLTSHLENLAVALSLSLTPLIEENRHLEIGETIKKLRPQVKTRITVLDSQGQVLTDSDRDLKNRVSYSTYPEIALALNGKTGIALRIDDLEEEEMLHVAFPVKKEGEVIGVIRMSLPLSEINTLFQQVKKVILYSLLFIVIVILSGTIFLSQSLSTPVRQLINVSRRIASGDFSVRIFFKNKGELKELADSFNSMSERLKSTFGELSKREEELKGIISNLQDGILLIDEKGKITLFNESLKKMLKKANIKGKFYWELVREPTFNELMRKVQKDKVVCQEITFEERIFSCTLTMLPSGREVLVVFRDITEQKNIEKLKKDFILNVSHELRTPLTAIRGFVETLEEEVDEKAKYYLQIIKRHTDRLINIIRDLLFLSEIEEEKKLQMEKVDLGKMMEKIVPLFKPRLTSKNLSLTLEVDSHLPLIKGDPFKLEQVFINLLDNAVKYTERGGITVNIKKIENEDKICIKIQDTGIGIPGEHLSRIFERFYVVDKSRSRSSGGTGLGLSIVKHIVLMHNGSINVKSMVGSGTTFTIFLPINPS